MKLKHLLLFLLLFVGVSKSFAYRFWLRIYYSANVSCTIEREGGNSQHNHDGNFCQYKSSESDEMTMSLIAPILEGYTFLGWKQCSDNNFNCSTEYYSKENKISITDTGTRSGSIVSNGSHDDAKKYYFKAIYSRNASTVADVAQGSNVQGEWNYATGVYDGGVERYNNDGADYAPGTVLSQRISGLAPGLYILKFASAASAAQHNGGGVSKGSGIARKFVKANGQTMANDMTVWEQTSVDLDDAKWQQSFVANVGADGLLEYGLENIANGGNWYTCKFISLTKLEGNDVSVPENVGMTTYTTPYAMDFSNTALKAYKITSVNSSYVHLDEVGQVPAGTPLFLIGETEKVPVIANAPTVDGNLLVACTEQTTVSKAASGANYVFAYNASNIEETKGFYSIGATPATVPAGKAYLHVDGTAGNSRLLIGFDDETGISNIGTEEGCPADGKYLENGKVVIVKNGVHYIINGLKK